VGAETERQMHFDAMPMSGERVEIDGEFYKVACAWRVPSDSLAGSKAALIARKRVDRAAPLPTRFWDCLTRRGSRA
jgi:hypothetical protein